MSKKLLATVSLAGLLAGVATFAPLGAQRPDRAER